MSTHKIGAGRTPPVPAESLNTPDGTTIEGAGIDADKLRINPQGAAAAIAPFLPPSPGGAPDPSSLAYTYEDFTNAGTLVGITSAGAPKLATQFDTNDAGSGVLITSAVANSFGVCVCNASPAVDADGFAQWNLGGVVDSSGGCFVNAFGPTTADLTVDLRVQLAIPQVVGQSAIVGLPFSDTVPMPDYAPSNGLFFDVDPDAHGNDHWWVDGSDTGVVATYGGADGTVWQRLRVVVLVPGDVAKFYISNQGEDFVLVHTMAAPAHAYTIGARAFCQAGLDLPGNAVSVDYVLATYPVDRS